MMTVHSMKIRATWSSATKVKIPPANRENVFRSMSDRPKFEVARDINVRRSGNIFCRLVGQLRCNGIAHGVNNAVTLQTVISLRLLF
jgi:hypothetical protein